MCLGDAVPALPAIEFPVSQDEGCTITKRPRERPRAARLKEAGVTGGVIRRVLVGLTYYVVYCYAKDRPCRKKAPT